MPKLIGLGAVFFLIAAAGCTKAFDSKHAQTSSSLLEDLKDDEDFTQGKVLYQKNCAGCHGGIDISDVRNKTADDILTAIDNFSIMSRFKNSNLDFEKIAYALSDNRRPDSGSPNIIAEKKFTCNDQSQRGLSNYSGRRLTQFELKATLSDLFGEDIKNQIESTIELYPDDHFGESVADFNEAINPMLVRALFEISDQLGTVLFDTQEKKARLLPACMLNSLGNFTFDDDECVKGFVETLGLKMYRRPLSTEEVKIYFDILKSDTGFHEFHRHRMAAVIGAMMLNPNFISLTSYSTDRGSRRSLDNYSIASRMSYALTGSMPDAELFAAAAAGKLDSIAERRKHGARLVNSAKARKYVRHVFKYILDLDRDVSLNSAYETYLKDSRGMNIQRSGLVEDLRNEALNFVEHIVFEKNGSFADIMSSPMAFPVSDNSARIFETSKSNGVQDPRKSNAGHVGLYMRPIFLLSTSDRTSPIVRGVKISRKVLCTHIPDPDPELQTQAEEALADFDMLNTTAREQAHIGTKGAVCQTCHKHLNPPGFLYEGFGPFGEKRSAEAVFDGNGTFVKTLPLETNVDDLLLDGVPQPMASSSAFNAALPETTQARACFAENIVQYAQLRPVADEDNCRLSDVEEAVKNGESILNTFVENAISEDQLWVKNN